VIVRTADEMSGGTDANVFLSIFGDRREEVKVPLKNPKSKRNPFEKANYDKFELDLKNVGKIKKISIEHDGKKSASSWKLEFVKIYHLNTLYT
jgi:hypothetical protein